MRPDEPVTRRVRLDIEGRLDQQREETRKRARRIRFRRTRRLCSAREMPQPTTHRTLWSTDRRSTHSARQRWQQDRTHQRYDPSRARSHLGANETIVGAQHGHARRRRPNEHVARPDVPLIRQEDQVAPGDQRLNLLVGYEAVVSDHLNTARALQVSYRASGVILGACGERACKYQRQASLCVGRQPAESGAHLRDALALVQHAEYQQRVPSLFDKGERRRSRPVGREQ